MKDKNGISLGPGAASLTLIFVMLGMSILGMLCLMSGRSDEKMSRRAIEVAQTIYLLNARAEEDFAELDGIMAEYAGKAASDQEYLEMIGAGLDEKYTMYDREISWIADQGERTLVLAAEVRPLGSSPRIQWKQHSLETESGTEESWDW